MKTIVYQSFRTSNVPGFISSCLNEAKAWAKQHGFDYRLYDDAFFELIPAELRARAMTHKCLASDFARVVAARDLLASGYDRAIWLDADALVFDPANFAPRTESNFSYAREVWLHRTWLGRPQLRLTVNNTLSTYCRDQTIIEHYLDCATRILRSDQTLNPTSIGTDWLLNLARSTPLNLETRIGVFNPELAHRYLAGDATTLRAFLNLHTSPISAVNLCLSKFGTPQTRYIFDDATAQHVIDRLLADRGASLNRHFTGDYSPTTDEFNRSHSRYLSLRDAIQSLAAATK